MHDLLAALPGVRGRPRWVSLDQLRLIVDDAASAIPEVISALSARGIAVQQIQEYHPSFDEVFVELMEQSDVEPVE
jgi:hypothetical protein